MMKVNLAEDQIRRKRKDGIVRIKGEDEGGRGKGGETEATCNNVEIRAQEIEARDLRP